MNEENANALNNVIQNIQEKMNEGSNSNVDNFSNDNTNNNNNNSNNYNYSNSNSNNNNNSSFDFSNIMNFINSNSSNESNNNNTYNSDTSHDSNDSNNSDNSNFNFDPSILLKAQQILSAMNSKSPKKDLLLSLKPFLRKSRQDKMSEYMTILNVLTILDNFKNNKGSD